MAVDPSCFLGLDPDNRLLNFYELYYNGGGGGGGSLSAEAVDAATFAPAYSEGQSVPFAVDMNSGGLLAHTRKMTSVDDNMAILGHPSQSTFRILSSAASTNASGVKAAPGSLIRITGYNSNAAARYLKLYDKPAAPVVGVDDPIWTEYLGASSKFTLDFVGGPLYFKFGIALAITTGSGDGDTGALSSGDIIALNVSFV